MNISYFDNYDALSDRATDIFIETLRERKNALVCSATGGSPHGLYERLQKKYEQDAKLFDSLRILKLDEWGGIPMDDKNSSHTYLVEKVLQALHVSDERYVGFDSETDRLPEECKRIQKFIDNTGPIDLTILGLGKNGHLGFNEPAPFLHADCHIARLAATTVGHSMVKAMPNTPTFGMTVGMKGILSSRKILLLIAGAEKEDAIKVLMTKEVTTQLPASLLWMHGNVECLIDKTSI
jgi:galactosamine-6-phosphate isomerase